jgi:hypothetical protein
MDRRRARDVAREVEARTADGTPLILLRSPSTKTGPGKVTLPVEELPVEPNPPDLPPDRPDAPPDAGVREPRGPRPAAPSVAVELSDEED